MNPENAHLPGRHSRATSVVCCGIAQNERSTVGTKCLRRVLNKLTLSIVAISRRTRTPRRRTPFYSQADPHIQIVEPARSHLDRRAQSCKQYARPVQIATTSAPGGPKCGRGPRSRGMDSQQIPTAYPETPHLTYGTRPVRRGPNRNARKHSLRFGPENTHLRAPRRAIPLSSTLHPLPPRKVSPVDRDSANLSVATCT
jgi:hypothetical protein